MLKKTEVVLNRRRMSGRAVDFDPSVDSADLFVRLSAERWADMGEPEQIVVTVKPGDRIKP